MKDYETISNKSDKDPTYFLSNRDKLRLMLSSINMIDNIQLDLNDLNNLKQHLDFDPFFEIKEKNEMIIGLLDLIKNTSDQFELQNAKANGFFTMSESVTTQINKKLLYLESLLSVMEKKKKPIKS